MWTAWGRILRRGLDSRMSEIATPTARRLRRPSLKDSRFIIGLLLVLLSTVLGAVVVSRFDSTVPRLVAARQLVAGDPLTEADVIRVDVRLGDVDTAYLTADSGVPADLWVLRDLRPGELIPASAVGSRSAIGVQPVALSVDPASAASLTTGSVVDVYVNRPAKKQSTTIAGKEFEGPTLALPAVTVARVEEQGRVGVGSSSPRAVQVLVETDRVSALVADVDAGAKITLVLVPGSVTRPTS